MLYSLHELRRAFVMPAVDLARAGTRILSEPEGWFALLPGSAHLLAGCELAYRLGRDYPKPEFGIRSVHVRGVEVAVQQQVVLGRPFCRLLRFDRCSDDPNVAATLRSSPAVLVVAPLSGHHATLLRDTVRSLLADHDVYITDWIDARLVPADAGAFSLDDYVAYLRDFIDRVGASRLHVIAVCQPAVPAVAACAQLAAAGAPTPHSLTLMGGPIDARINPTQVGALATAQPLHWFREHMLHEVPAEYPGRGRRVYPGFLQHAAFIAMNLDRHIGAHWDFYDHVARGDLPAADAHRRFYDEYNAVLDMPAEYYIDCVRVVFQEHLLPRGLWDVAGERVNPGAIAATRLLTVEGELDDITGLGQTRAAHALFTGVPSAWKHHLTVPAAGHYGIFSGRRWRDLVYPRVRDFIASSHP